MTEERMQRERAVIVGVNLKGAPDFERSMEELSSLAEACGMETVARVDQNLEAINNAYYVGSGKTEEIRRTAALLEADCVVFDNTLSPSQMKNLQDKLEKPVVDRTGLILEIFSLRAQTREARLQVEAARLKYMLPRLSGMRAYLSRQGGRGGSGFSNKGSGEKKLELDRRKLEKRISGLEKELKIIEKDRETQRKARKRGGIPRAALAGYTNAGKSTLLNRLLECGAASEGAGGTANAKKVMEKDMLFATLDTWVRKITPGRGGAFLVSDTVGFINGLPHDLIKAFRSTLEEIRQADLILEVVDCSDEHYREQMKVTQDTLRELGAASIPRIYVMNKADKVMDRGSLPRVKEDRIYLSARYGEGIEELVEMVQERLLGRTVSGEWLIPYDEAGALSGLRKAADISEVEYGEDGIRVTGGCRPERLNKYGKFMLNNGKKGPHADGKN